MCNENFNNKLRKCKKIKIKQQYFGGTNFRKFWVFATVNLEMEINGSAKSYASKRYLILLLAKVNFKNAIKMFTLQY